MNSTFTAEQIQEMKDFLKNNPIDHRYDEDCECFDSDVPHLQLAARGYDTILKNLGELSE